MAPEMNVVKPATGLRRAVLLGCASVLTLMPTKSFSQDAVEEAVTLDGSAVVLDTIIVNARRVEEELQNSPVAVTVQTADDFGTAKIDRIADLAKTAPNVIAFDANALSFVIRGVGSQNMQGLNNEAGVGIFIDEVYLGRPDAVPYYLDDIEQTEIVRGSQATIYGRNTIGGTVSLSSRRPGDTFAGQVETSFGSDGYWRVRGGVDVPLTEDGRWLSRTYLTYTSRPDGINNLATGEDDLTQDAFAGRFAVTGEVGDATSVYFTVDFEQVDDNGQGGWSPVDLALKHESDLDFPAGRKDKRYGAMLRLEHDFDNFWFHSISAFRGYTHDYILDGDFSSGPYDPANQFYALQQGREQRFRQFTQEFRIGSYVDGEPLAGELNWNTGLFFLGDDLDGYEFYDLDYVPRNFVSRNGVDTSSTAVSAFGNVDYQVTNRLGLSGGLRITQENRWGDIEVTSPSGTNFYGYPESGSTSVSFFDVSPEAGIDFKVTDNALVYGRVARGFKSGGIAQFFNADGSVNTYDPETSLSFEAGAKIQLFNGRAALDFAAFHTNWNDQQSNVFISDIQRVTANASSAVSRGFEISADALLTDEFRIRATYGYLDAHYEDFRYSFYSARSGRTETVDYSGNPIPLSPKHSASLSLDWEKEFDNGLTLLASSTYSYRSSYTFDSVAAYEQPDTHLIDASFGVRKGNWEAQFWGKNLLDEDYLSNYFLAGSTDYGIAAPGRTFGVSLKASW
ncbi:MAG: TonB-dependent receptor [Pseudomonadota bacterium]